MAADGVFVMRMSRRLASIYREVVGTVTYYGVATPLSVAARYLSAAANDGYAIVAGGRNHDGYQSNVDAYSVSCKIPRRPVCRADGRIWDRAL